MRVDGVKRKKSTKILTVAPHEQLLAWRFNSEQVQQPSLRVLATASPSRNRMDLIHQL